ncbi:hypothetical protein BST63_01080 [Bradyrhizobium canariense]|uniref:Transposase n=1 Tax=Bradyrhizobium canariense TaxID=255045 RepID=A0ABX3XCG7_9BRAD|nr:hypothetical protein [Bradyrhizobium canariense]OSJ35980.1 hypothetical protein BST63_01080 [Bradyrhizobium canariense]
MYAKVAPTARGILVIGEKRLLQQYHPESGPYGDPSRCGMPLACQALSTQADRAHATREESGSSDAGVGREREVEKLHARIGRLIMERDYLAKISGR